MDELEHRADALAAETDFSGVVRVDRSGETALAKAYGLADRAHRIPMSLDTQLAVASGSKTLTALVVMSLVENKTLTLSHTAREILGKDLPLIADDVTVEHLLAHRSGIGDYLDEEEDSIEDYPMPISVHRLATTEQYLEVLDGHPTKFPAGERFSYCNGGYVVLALLAERVGGATFHELVRELVCVPAGMMDTEFLRSDRLPGRAAIGYVEIDGEWRTNVFHLPVLGSGDGGIYTTAADVARFWDALFGERIVSAKTLAEMLRPRSTSGPSVDSDRYGLGFWLRAGTDHVRLGGADAGVSFRSVHDPATRSTCTVMSNTSNGAWKMAEVLTSAVLGHGSLTSTPSDG